jgi:hypothetical protein
MQEKIKQLYDQSNRDAEHAAAYHSLIFDIEGFAQRIVFRCAMAAKLAQTEGRDAYTDIMEKYGTIKPEESDQKQQLNFHKLGEEIPLVGEEPNELIPDPIDDNIAKKLVELVNSRHKL